MLLRNIVVEKGVSKEREKTASEYYMMDDVISSF